MSRTRGGARSECSESSQEGTDRDEDRHSRKAFGEYIQGCVERFLETGRNSLSVKPYKKVANYFVGRMLGEGTFGKVKLAIHVLSGVKVSLSARNNVLLKVSLCVSAGALPIIMISLYHFIESYSSCI